MNEGFGPLTRDSKVAVIGAGAMGSGIAQVAATFGHQVMLYDTSSDALHRASASIEKYLARDVEKQRITAEAARQIRHRIRMEGGTTPTTDSLDALFDCALVIEAIVEDLEVKRDTFSRIEDVVSDSAILATNTSSLSVTAIGKRCRRAERLIGLHFFNPPTVLPLVEVIPGLATHFDVTNHARGLMMLWGKTTVVAADTPGFIVNRIARPFYGEALRIYEEQIADMPTIDWAMRDIGGFRMGPFELMDFIGNDVNFAATQSVFAGTFFDPRYRPSRTQQRLVEAGFLGRKSGRGYYDYSDGARRPEPVRDRELGERIFGRVLAMLINEAADAVLFGIASPSDVDLAMTRGVNYPKGLLAWADEIGIEKLIGGLDALYDEYREDRYRASALLRRMAAEGTTFAATQR